MNSRVRAIQTATLTAVLFASTAAWAGAPAWVDGKDPRYKRNEYVIGVGKGPKQESADIDARAEVSRVFESNIKAVAKDFQAAATKINGSGKGVSVEVQAVEQFQQVTTKKTLSAIELRERGKDGSTFYTLALLSREQCMNSLKEQIDQIDQKISGHLSRAEGGDKLSAFKAYGAAMNLMDDREGLNAMLRVCDPSGKGIPPSVSIGDLAAKFDEASGSLKIGIDLQGSGAARVRDCLMEALGQGGYQVSEIKVDDEDSDSDDDDGGGSKDFDAIIRGRLKSEKAGDVGASTLVRTDLTLKLINPKTNKTLKTVTANRKEGRPSVKAAAALSAYKICQKEMPNVVKEIDKYFKK